MILLALVLIPANFLIIYVFLYTTPKNTEKKETRIINLLIFGISIIGCIGVSVYSYLTTGKSVDSSWWPVLAFFGSIIVFMLILIVGGVYRNFIHFK